MNNRTISQACIFIITIFLTGAGIFSLNAQESHLRPHPWPMFHGQPTHTGFADVVGSQKGQIKWQVMIGELQGNRGPGSVLVSADGTIYTTAPDALVAVDKNGQVLWTKNYPGSHAPALSSDGNTIYLLAQQSIVALDTAGNEQWRYQTGGTVLFGLTIADDGTLYQGSWDGYIYALNPDGTLKWRYQTAGCVSYPVTLGTDGTLYVGGGDAHCRPDSNLYALSPDGTLKWTFDTGHLNQRVGSPAVSDDGRIIVPAVTLFILNPDGSLEREIGTREQLIAGIISPAIAPDGTLYIGSPTGLISAINPLTGETLWTFQTGADPEKPDFYGVIGFPVVDREGTLYVGAVDGKMVALDRNGTLKWTIQTGGRITETSPALDEDGVLYFTSDDGYLYAIGDD